ncbi:hypothetical protein TNCV_3917491 [Trichonephila clavipes]|nr:hypothetical protein TNCV_3917491 [Trichonephila clavipes]
MTRLTAESPHVAEQFDINIRPLSILGFVTWSITLGCNSTFFYMCRVVAGQCPSAYGQSYMQLVTAFSQKEVLDHPPYRPDLVLSYFHLFKPLKKHLRGQHFRMDAEVQQSILT